ncbi:hypothetical protein Nepgr_010169 [Nepenthes gracilis]|uniref:C3H1-type domain-containing protein n=1 Tax=Nepenthes gracilis TaxID=150966 RepID=A0AAD3SCV5_NEPGR|nr:hypothetical protein Nepgr_010169 [Nepenthes gracilis]
MTDRYGMAEGSPTDPATEWAALRGETGLERGRELYPERPGEPDCIYYLRTGSCGYGARCLFNHPHDRGGARSRVGRPGAGEYPERSGQPFCQYYMRTGTCKFGSSCKYHHPRQGAGPLSPAGLASYRYPQRPGEKECPYYMKTGQCKFGMTCKFHHPQAANVQLPATGPLAAVLPAAAPIATSGIYPSVQSHPAPSSQPYGFVTGNWQVGRPPMMPGSFVQGPYGPMLLSSGLLPFPSWASYQAEARPYPSVASAAASSSGTQKELSCPERPGQPECQFYPKTGNYKFGSSFEYHLPPEWLIPRASHAVSQMGLSLRPGAPIRTYYAEHGICIFKPTCKFDHPMVLLSCSPSISSLSDMPFSPYLVGSPSGTLAPSSSSDLPAEAVLGSSRDPPTRISSPTGISSSSISSMNGYVHPSSILQPSQSSTPPASSSSSNSSAAHEEDVHASS